MRGNSAPTISKLGDACCGCGACAAVCPKNCIEMRENHLGFRYPAVDVTGCVGCGNCERACPAIRKRDQDGCERVLWARAKNTDLLGRSSSGGMFGLLADSVLTEGGIVVGATWDEHCEGVHHVVVTNASDLDDVMQSKYVQSSVGREIYRVVRDSLRAGRKVLFSGTACQVAGMRGYLGELADSKDYLGIDVVCHGVPSPLLWRKWVEFVGVREGGRVTDVNMRSKTTGWQSYSVAYRCIGEGDAPEYSCSTVFNQDWYMRAFLSNASLRPSCYACPVKRSSGSDITLGDFWGVQKRQPEAFSDNGVSAVIANTSKGIEAIEAVLESAEWGDSSFELVAAGNPSLLSPVKPFRHRTAFIKDIADGMPMSDIVGRWSFQSGRIKKAATKVLRTAEHALEKVKIIPRC